MDKPRSIAYYLIDTRNAKADIRLERCRFRGLVDATSNPQTALYANGNSRWHLESCEFTGEYYYAALMTAPEFAGRINVVRCDFTGAGVRPILERRREGARQVWSGSGNRFAAKLRPPAGLRLE